MFILLIIMFQIAFNFTMKYLRNYHRLARIYIHKYHSTTGNIDNFIVLVNYFMLEFYSYFRHFQKLCSDGNKVIVKDRFEILYTYLNNRQNYILTFQFLVANSNFSKEISPADMKVPGIISMVHISHFVNFIIPDLNFRFRCYHEFQIIKTTQGQ